MAIVQVSIGLLAHLFICPTALAVSGGREAVVRLHRHVSPATSVSASHSTSCTSGRSRTCTDRFGPEVARP